MARVCKQKLSMTCSEGVKRNGENEEENNGIRSILNIFFLLNLKCLHLELLATPCNTFFSDACTSEQRQIAYPYECFLTIMICQTE